MYCPIASAIFDSEILPAIWGFTLDYSGHLLHFFRALQLLSDIADSTIDRGELPFPKLLLFLLSFLTFAAGPLQHYQQFCAQLPGALATRLSDLDWPIISKRTTLGAIKLLILTPLFAPLPGDILALEAPAWLRLGAASCMFLLYIYISFSGYMDWMVAFGRAVGLTLPENFHQPYRAANFLDLWNHWHITLSYTFKLYVFNPILRLLLTHAMPSKRVLAGVIGYFIVFFLLGSWHGSDWRFGYFGFSLGLLAAGTKLLQTLRPQPAINEIMQIASAAASLGLLAIACIFTWPGWKLPDILDLLNGPMRVVLASLAAIVIASLIVIACRVVEKGCSTPRARRYIHVCSESRVAASCWLLIGILLHSLLTEPSTGALIYYQRF